MNLPPILLSPRIGIEIDLRVSLLSLLNPGPPPVTVEEECCKGWGRWDCCITCWRRFADGCCCCVVSSPLAAEEWWCEWWGCWVFLPTVDAAVRMFPYDWRWRTPSMLFISFTTKVRHKHPAFRHSPGESFVDVVTHRTPLSLYY